MSDQRLLSEIQWLADNPHFAERPATIREFIGADYLALQDTIRPGVMAALIEIFGEDVDPNWISLKRRAVATGGIGWGKCSTLDAMVNLSDGTYKRAGDIRPGDRTPGGLVVASESNGVKPVYTVTTTWGQELELTGNHPVWVEGKEWVHVEDLQPGDELRVHRGWEAENPHDLDADLYRLAGYLIADGGLTQPTPTWGKGNVHLDQDMHEICARRGWSMREMSPGRHESYRQYRIRSNGDLRRLLVDLGMYGKGAAEKSVPDFVFRSSNAMIEQFLCAYLESDGHLDEHGSEFYSVSRELLWGVQKLLLRLGVVSKLQAKNGRYKGEVHKSWRLRVPAAGWNVIRQWDFKDESNRCQAFDYVDPDTVPLGLCGCGCGEETAVPAKNNRGKGDVRGVPKRFRRGHSNRHRPEVTNPTCRVESVTLKGEEETWAIQVEPTNHLYVEDVLTHNSTLASIILTYCVHWCYCLKDPQGFFKLMPGSRIAFMLMSTSESQAKEVLFADIKARIEGSPWFQQFCDYDRNFKNQLRMAKDLWIVPGGSEESRFEGYNVLVGIIDEGDSHKQTKRKDYAEEGYDTISSRISSRFTDPVSNKYRGLLVVIGQMKSKVGFMSKIYDEFKDDPDAAAIRMPYWLSFGWHHYTENPRDIEGGRETAPRKSFVYDVQHKRILSRADAEEAGVDFHTRDSGYLEVPTAFLTQFRRNPVKALRDLAGIPPEASDPFIALPHRISLCQEAWEQRMGEGSPVTDSATYPAFTSSFRPTNRIRRVAHVDIAYSGENGDAMGIAMAHIPGIISVDGEDKPLIVFDFLMRIKAKPGSQIELSEMRRILRQVRDDYGYNLSMITFDGFASVDSMQLLRKASFQVDYISVDRSKQPYEDLREGIYDERILFPKYMTHMNPDDSDTVNVAYQELSQLTDVGPKIDHPPSGSKDVADAMASCVSVLMQMPQWRRGAPLLETRSSDYAASDVESEDLSPLGEMFTKARKPQPVPGEVPSLSEFTSGRLGESSPGVTRVKERTSVPFVGSGRSEPVPGNPFLR